MALALVVLIGLTMQIVEQQPTPERMRPTPRPTLVVLTRVPAPVPVPTRSPLEIGSRSLSAPDAPVLLSGPESAVVNVACLGECVVGGNASWVTSDVLVKWTHADAPSVDEYEVWKSTMEPYFEPESCVRCGLAGTTTGLDLLVRDSPGGFNPVGGTAGATLGSVLDFFMVRATNGGGTSELSNRIGVVTWSLLQGIGAVPR